MYITPDVDEVLDGMVMVVVTSKNIGTKDFHGLESLTKAKHLHHLSSYSLDVFIACDF